MVWKHKTNLFTLYAELYNELRKHKIGFSKSGFPYFRKSFFVTKSPSEILPFRNRLKCKNKKTTALSTFCDDLFIYPRLKNLKADLPIYKEYYAVVVFDLSPRAEWKTEQQRFNICLNQMAAIYLALNGVKLIGNFRIGNHTTYDALHSYPNNTPFCVGTLGCTKEKDRSDIYLFEQKILINAPKECWLYGRSENKQITNVLKDYSIKYEVFKDFRTQSYAKTLEAHNV